MQTATFQKENMQAGGNVAANLAGRLAVVTGASSGIGRAIAEELAGRGASICLIGRRPETLRAVAPRMDGAARKLIYQIDLGIDAEVENLPGHLLRGACCALPADDAPSGNPGTRRPVRRFRRRSRCWRSCVATACCDILV